MTDTPSAAVALPLGWQRKMVYLPFRAGELPLFTLPLDALELSSPPMSRDTEHPAPPFDALVPPIELLLARSFPVGDRLPRVARLAAALRYVPTQYRRFFVDLGGTFEDYTKTFSSKTRSTFARKLRKFAAFSGGRVDVREYRSRSDMRTFLPLGRELSRRTYQERLLRKGLPSESRFADEVGELADEGRIRAYLLLHEDRAVAYMCCPVQDRVALYEYVGFDPDYAEWSPGTVLQYLVLERMFKDRDLRRFDFTEGEGDHKELFATDHVFCADVYYFRPSARNSLLVAFHAALATASAGAGRALDRLGLKRSLRALLRGRRHLSS